jgi:hypothetical protein
VIVDDEQWHPLAGINLLADFLNLRGQSFNLVLLLRDHATLFFDPPVFFQNSLSAIALTAS